ncbi:MAG: isochorismatase family protein [Mariniphaga sp.]|nr:isochorismatase family protein [Mariniphaga sp.]MDD4226314.1 isochorismatase family protein [Mariniphaga sp.]MDD4424513.1 isochorismatase family protein [Mariniphaga sp.]
MRISKQKTISLIIDIQERLFPVMQGKEELLRNCQILIRGLNTLGIPHIVTQQYTKGLGETIEEIQSILPDFTPVEKREFSCYNEPHVISRIHESDAQHIIICGIESHVCVLQTAIDLKQAGLNPVVVMDCVSSRHRRSVDLAIERLRFESIMITSAESILFELTRSSAAPEFKAISGIVK